ncbi:MAG: sensor histidine kinase [Pseudomonadota bacterium]
MRIRYYGIMLLIVVGVLPLATAGLLMVRRAERTALAEVLQGNQRIAVRAAGRLNAFVEAEVAMLRTVGAALAPTVGNTPKQAERVVKNYVLSFPHLRELSVVGLEPTCHEIATSRVDGAPRDRCGEAAVDKALAGTTYLGEVALSNDFAPLMTIAVPLEQGGELVGAAVATVDMVGIWKAVKEIRVGDRGYARLVTSDDTLLAHGDPEERRRVFLCEKDPFASSVRGSSSGARYRNSQDEEVVSVSADVAGVGWTLIVEEPVAEAYRAATVMKKDLFVVVGLALVLTVGLGIVIGNAPVRAIEAVRSHAGELARGNLAAKIVLPPLNELRALADTLNAMGEELARLQESIKAQERLSTFAQVAAGLAHDLQSPIESVRGACEMTLRSPEDDRAAILLQAAVQSHLPRLHRYIRDLRRLAHGGRIPLEFSEIDPRALVDRIVAEANTNAKWQGVTFSASGKVEAILADESLLVRAVSNLVSNAGDACISRWPPQGVVVVEVAEVGAAFGASAARDSGAAANHDNASDLGGFDTGIVISIQDNGVGIPSERLTRILANDFQSTKRQTGVGLGLGVARHVVSAHDGTLTAESTEGKGSTFSITLPRRRLNRALGAAA